MGEIGTTELYDFVTHPYWSQVEVLLRDLEQTLLRAAARAITDHDFQRGRLEGAESARGTIQRWLKETAKELAKNAANRKV